MIYRRPAALTGACAALIAFCGGALAQTCPAPKTMNFRVEGEIQRDIRGLTQGLEVRGDVLFESTGAIAGDTRLTTIDARGKVTVLANFGKRFFGEGLTILKDQIYQLSWKERAAFVYDLKGTLVRRMTNPRDGWGLTNDGANLIATDGGDRLFYLNPANLALVRAVPVRAGTQPVEALNELEMVEGKIFANIFTTWTIVRVEPRTGCVEAAADLNDLWSRMDANEQRYIQSDNNFVLNGIAYDGRTKLFYVTGKNWRTIYTGRFVDAG
jgi:glutaminyl-peptide cyclotransferase